MSNYAASTDLVSYYDWELVGDLATDDRVRLSRADVLTHENVTKAITAASGEVDVNLLAGGRYTTIQLEALTGSAEEHLKRIVCAVAMGILVQRRLSMVNSDLAKVLMDAAKDYMKALAGGKNVFGLPEEIEAGLPSVDGPTSLDYSRMRLMPDRMGRHFADRAQRLPTDRG